MSDNLANQLGICLDHITKDGWTIEQALAQFPAQRDELEALLQLTNKIAPLAQLDPRPEFAKNARIRLENLLPNSPKTVTSAPRIRHKQRKSILFSKRRFAMTWIVTILTAISLLAGGTGAVFASADALPGDMLYQVKLGIEDLRLGFAGDEEKIDLLLENSETRLDEMDALLFNGRFADLQEALDGYQAGVEDLMEHKNRVSYEDAPSEDAQTLRIEEQLQIHAGLLEQLKVQLQTQEQTKLQTQVGELLQVMEQTRLNMPESAPNGPSEDSPGQSNQGEEPGTGNADAPQGNEDGSGGPNADSPGQGGQSEDSSGQGGQSDNIFTFFSRLFGQNGQQSNGNKP